MPIDVAQPAARARCGQPLSRSVAATTCMLLSPSEEAAREDADDGDHGGVEEEVAEFGHQVAAGRVDRAEQQGRRSSAPGIEPAPPTETTTRKVTM